MPGLIDIERFLEQLTAALQGSPSRVLAHESADVGRSRLQALLEIEVVGLNKAARRMLDRPDHCGESACSDLKAGGIRVCNVSPCLLDREL